MAGEGPEDERELAAERWARLRALVRTCKPALEQARGPSLFAPLALDPETLYALVLEAEALAALYAPGSVEGAHP